MRLNVLNIRNFRGIESLYLNINGQSVVLEGDNGTGKSTVREAYLWLLTGKDSTGATDYNIRNRAGTLVLTSQDKDPSVFAEFIDETGDTYSFSRVKQACCTSNDRHYAGDETRCYVDGIKKTSKEYSEAVCRILGTGALDIATVTDIYYVPEKMSNDARRSFLINVFGTKNDEEFADSSARDDFKKLVLNKGKRSLEEYIMFLKSENKRVHNEIIKCSTLKEEYKNIENDVLDEAKSNEKLCELRKQIEQTVWQKAQSEFDDKNNKIKAKLDRTQSALKQLLKENEEDRYNQELAIKSKYKAQKLELEIKIAKEKAIYETKSERLKALGLDSEQMSIRINSLRFMVEEAKKRQFKEQTFCPICGQNLPETMQEDARASFNERKANEIEKLEKEYASCENTFNEFKKKETNLKSDMLTTKKNIEELSSNLHKLNALSGVAKARIQDIKGFDEKKKRLEDKINVLKNQIKSSNNYKNDNYFENRLKELRIQEQQAQRICIKAKENKERIEKVTQISEKIKELTELEGQILKMLDLCSQFYCDKAKSVESEINKHFNVVKFKLFDLFGSGGIKNTCEAFVNEVPYRVVNRAGKTSAAIDIVTTILKHLGIDLPLFIDDLDGIYSLDLSKMKEQVMVSHAVEERCPVCGGQSGLRDSSGKWTCNECSNTWAKELKWRFLRDASN